MNKKISAVIIAFIAVYGSITFAKSATDNCYFSIDYRIIFDGPCNETIAEIEANFETRYEQRKRSLDPTFCDLRISASPLAL